MLLPQFEFHEPQTVEEACQLLGDMGPKARPLAGGTDLLVNMKKKLIAPENLISLDRIDTLKGISSLDDGLSIGACMKVADVAEATEIKEMFPALAEGASKLGSPLIRNLATAAGNLVSARPAADLPPSLIAYGADLIVRSASGERTLPLEGLFTGPGLTVLGPDEMVESIRLKRQPDQTGSAYIKLGVRETLEISIVNVAACLTLENNEIKSARIVLGSVAPTPVRAPSAEKALVGEKPSDALLAKAGEAAAADAKPIDDFRASAAYRRDMVSTLTRRALALALDRAA
ncbi:MAG: xanthine dehydrogenase family protein subunit M [Desulfobacteraceae bacterium]|jgi:carbon-monoxide dehydrogenase medium subunit